MFGLDSVWRALTATSFIAVLVACGGGGGSGGGDGDGGNSDRTAPVATQMVKIVPMLALDPIGTSDPQICAIGRSGKTAVALSGFSWPGSSSIFVQLIDSDGSPIGSTAQLDSVDVANDYSPQITALGESGAFVVAWLATDVNHSVIFIQRFDANGAIVGDPVPITGSGLTAPQIAAVGGEGAFVVAWWAYDDDLDTSVFVQRFDANGSAVGNPLKLEPAGVTDKSDLRPLITPVGGNGAFAVSWLGQRSDGLYRSFVQYFDTNGEAVGVPVQLDAPDALIENVADNRITTLTSEGAFAVLWTGSDSNHDVSIFVQRFDAGGAVAGDPVQIQSVGNSYLNGFANDPQISAVGDQGALALAWISRDDDDHEDYSVFVQLFDSDGATVGERTQLEPTGIDWSADSNPKIAALGSDGAFVVAWQGLNGIGDGRIYLQLFDASGDAVDKPVKIECPAGITTCGYFQPLIVATGNESAFEVAWSGTSTDSLYRVFVQHISPDESLKIPAIITNSGNVIVQSTEPGTAYLVNDSVSVGSLSDITGSADSLWNQAAVTQADTDTVLSADGLVDGSYNVYTVDAAGNLSVQADNGVVIGSL